MGLNPQIWVDHMILLLIVWENYAGSWGHANHKLKPSQGMQIICLNFPKGKFSKPFLSAEMNVFEKKCRS